MKKCFRDGGATYVNVSKIDYGGILKKKRVLVTGGTGGIGLAIAKKCLSEGAQVVVSGRNAQKLEAVVRELDHSGLKAMVWDVGDIDQMEEKLAKAMRLIDDRLDILVNNAGVLIMKPFLEVTEEIWDTVYSTNSKGLFFLTRAVSDMWIKRKAGGKILNISSSGGFLGAPHPYRMTKWDIVGLTRGLGVELLPYGILVNGIAPGMTATEMVGMKPHGNAYLANYPPSNRAALPEEIAELALFLMSDAANHIVGQTIICDGGYSLKN